MINSVIECKFENGKVGQLRHVVTDALIIKDKKILLTKRADSLREGGKWALPGGYVDHNETIIEGMIREIQEEIGYTAVAHELFTIKDSPTRRHDPRQNITFIFIVELIAKVAQPDPAEVADMQWFSLDKLPLEVDMAFDHLEIIWEWIQQQDGQI